MKRSNYLVALLLSGTTLLSSCGLGTMGTTTSNAGTAAGTSTTSTSGSTTSTTSNGNVLGSVLGGVLGGNGQSGELGAIIGSVLGTFAQSTTEKTILGTWTYQEPAVQFTSDNMLAKAGGAVAGQKVVEKIEPYYQKVGIKPGKFSITFNQDKTCSYTINSKTYQGTYTFDEKSETIIVKGSVMSFPKAYISVAVNNMALTYDSSKLLTVAQSIAQASGNATLSSIGEISKNFDGMKTGFLFVRK